MPVAFEVRSAAVPNELVMGHRFIEALRALGAEPSTLESGLDRIAATSDKFDGAAKFGLDGNRLFFKND